MSDIWHTWEDKPYRDATIIVERDDSSLCICMYMVEDKCEYEKSNRWCYLHDYFKDYNSIKQKLQKAKEEIETKQNTISDFIRTTFEKVTEYETKLFNKDKEIAELKARVEKLEGEKEDIIRLKECKTCKKCKHDGNCQNQAVGRPCNNQELEKEIAEILGENK